MNRYLHATLIVCLILPAAAHVEAQVSSETAAKIDSLAEKALAETATPSASIAVVKDGKIAYVKAYGDARLDPKTTAQPEMRYPIGSVSKQFMAGCVLLLAQEGKLSLDDRVAEYLPALTRASDITIRELLSHTSGYQDYYPLDYVAPFMQQPVTPEGILERWARKPLDFEPGTEWQYSNTNFVVAGQIVEKVTGMPAFAFLRSRILDPLGMTSVIDLSDHTLTESDAAGYTRFGRGPVRPATPEARGWLYAAGELAMTAHDLALWDQSLIEGKLLKPASLAAMTTPVRLKNGVPTGYGLGVGISNASGHPKLEHGGAVSGFVSDNAVWPDQGAAVVVLTNRDGTRAADSIAGQIGSLLAASQDPDAPHALEQARQVFNQLQEGKLDRALLTSDADSYFTPRVLVDAQSSLQPLGTPQSFEQTGAVRRGGMSYRFFLIRFASGTTLNLSTFSTTDGKLAQYLIQ
jgi:CubicO group peptidase (beta-lactamase class C family)